MMQENNIFAALDLGSNTCRLIVKKLTQGHLTFVDSVAQTIRLAEGIHEDQILTPAAIDRTGHALALCREKLDHYKPNFFRAVATEACRIAKNSHVIIDMAKNDFGIDLEVISAQEEAILSLRGCEELLDEKKNYAIVFDIGGASTEVLFVELQRKKHEITIHQTLSLPYGVVRISETYGKYMRDVFHDIRTQVSEKILSALGSFKIRSLARAHKLQLLGCSGTATTIAAMALNLRTYDRRIIDGARLTLKSIQVLSHSFHDATQWKKIVESESFLSLGKQDLIEPGLAILMGICDISPFPSLRVADRGVRDGIIASLAQEQKDSSHFNNFFKYVNLQRSA